VLAVMPHRVLRLGVPVLPRRLQLPRHNGDSEVSADTTGTLRSQTLCSHSVVSQHFMEPEGSLPSSQELSTCTYSEPDQSSPQHSILSLKGSS
jgi:hypothetical protein